MAKSVNTTMFAKNMLRLFRVEPVDHQVILTLQLAELIRHT